MLSWLNQTFASESCVPCTPEKKHIRWLGHPDSVPRQSVETRLSDPRTPSCRLRFVLNPSPEACPMPSSLPRPRFPLGPLRQARPPGPWPGPPFPVRALTPAAEALAPGPTAFWAMLTPPETRLSLRPRSARRPLLCSASHEPPHSALDSLPCPCPSRPPGGLVQSWNLRDLPSSEVPTCPWDLTPGPSSRVTAGPVSPESQVQDNCPSPPPPPQLSSESKPPRCPLSHSPFPRTGHQPSAIPKAPHRGLEVTTGFGPYELFSLHTWLVGCAGLHQPPFPCTVPQAAMLWSQLFCGSSWWKLLA